MKKKVPPTVKMIRKAAKAAKNYGYREYQENRNGIDFTARQLERVAKLIPAHWQIEISYRCFISIWKDEKHDTSPHEFLFVANTVFRALGFNNYEKDSETVSEREVHLVATNSRWFTYKGKKCWCLCTVRAHKPTCKVTFKKVVVPATIKTVAEVPPSCLGLSERG